MFVTRAMLMTVLDTGADRRKYQCMPRLNLEYRTNTRFTTDAHRYGPTNKRSPAVEVPNVTDKFAQRQNNLLELLHTEQPDYRFGS